jgi:putative NADH-flavin reductase
MKILILGVSGRTGLLTAAEAVKRGHQVVGIARNPDKVNIKGVELIEGTPYNFETVKKAIIGCNAIVGVLSSFPASQGIFGKINSPLDVMSVSLKNTIQLMNENQIKRIVLMTALGVSDSEKEVPWLFRFLVRISNIKYAYIDHEIQEKMLENSSLDWTILRPVMLTDKNEKLSVIHRIGKEGILKSQVSRNAMAHLILDSIEKELFIKQKPGISNP